MARQGDTVLYDHIEAKHTRKTRPAVILRVIGDTVLLVVGQTLEPRIAVLVQGKFHRTMQRAGLENDTYFDCENVIAAPFTRITRRLGQMPFRSFTKIERTCGARLQQQVARVNVEAQDQRRVLIDRLNQYAKATGCEIESIADQSRIARMRIRAIMSREDFLTREELVRIADVLGVEPAQLLEPET